MAGSMYETEPNIGADLPAGSLYEQSWTEHPDSCSHPTDIHRGWKRIFDLFLGTILLILAAPGLMVLMTIIKMNSPGPAIFSQKRLGRCGQEFSCYKLRSMYMDEQELLAKHLEEYPIKRKEWLRYSKLKGDDPRITACGRWMRSWSLDELPQIINVLKGEMSLVGPRPYLLEERSRMGESAGCILSALPGLTGLWQVSGRNEIDFNGRLQMEKYYVLNRSLGMDLLIMFKTIPVVFRQKGAY